MSPRLEVTRKMAFVIVWFAVRNIAALASSQYCQVEAAHCVLRAPRCIIYVVTFESTCDTTIDLVEFQPIAIVDKNKIKMSTKTTTTSFEQHLREMFELYDDDGSGGIDQHELRALMAQLGVDLTDQELSAMIAEADVDGDGDIDYEEFVALFKGIKVSGEEKKKNQQQQKRVVLQRKDSITGGIFDDAKQLMSFTSIFRFVTWLYSERKMILLTCSHFVATMVIWGECAFYCLDLMLKCVSYLMRVVSY